MKLKRILAGLCAALAIGGSALAMTACGSGNESGTSSAELFDLKRDAVVANLEDRVNNSDYYEGSEKLSFRLDTNQWTYDIYNGSEQLCLKLFFCNGTTDEMDFVTENGDFKVVIIAANCSGSNHSCGEDFATICAELAHFADPTTSQASHMALLAEKIDDVSDSGLGGYITENGTEIALADKSGYIWFFAGEEDFFV